MLTNRMPATDANDNDRLLAALAYFLSPIVSIIILLVESMKARPYQRYHALQSLPFGIIQLILACVIGPLTLGLGYCVSLLLLVVQIYYTIVAYQGAYFEIPVISSFMKQQGWLKGPGM